MSRAGRAGEHPGARSGLCELGRARQHLERAVAELKAARQVWGVWADGVREQAEQRLAVSDLRDARVMDDLEYARALDMGALCIRAVNAAEAALKAARSRGGDRAGAGEFTGCSCPAMGRK